MNRVMAVVACLLGFTGVALGAMGAHALKRVLEAEPDAAQRLAWWELGSRYHLVHALALLGVAVLAAHVPGRLPQAGAALLVVGVALFSGSLYAMALTGEKAFARLTPLGGVAFLCGWCVLAVAAWRLPAQRR